MPFTSAERKRRRAASDGAAHPPPSEVIDVRRPAANAFVLPTGPLEERDSTPIGQVKFRQRVQVRGRVRSLRVRPWADVPSLELVLVDGTGGITAVFLGRRHVPGVGPGTLMAIEGMVGAQGNRLAILNPHYDLRPFKM
jgi:hypothetical protein